MQGRRAGQLTQRKGHDQQPKQKRSRKKEDEEDEEDKDVREDDDVGVRARPPRKTSTANQDEDAMEIDIGDDDGSDHEVECIVRESHKEYLVKWVGYSKQHNSWVEKAHLTKGAPKVIADWNKKKRNRK